MSSVVLTLLHESSSYTVIPSANPTWWQAVHSWQTLIAGALAFIPASIAAVFVWRQLNEQREQFLKIQEASALKARLKLSRSLSHISHHLDKCYESLLAEDFSYSSHALSENLLNDILDAAVSAQSKNFAFFQNFVEKIQTYASLCGIQADSGNEIALANCFKSLAELDALTDRLYPFSRFESEKVSEKAVEKQEIKSRLEHNLRRGKNISGSNLQKLISLKHFEP